jgi:hypothetical protein
MQSRSYSPNGLAHHALALLAAGPATFADVCHAAGITRRKHRVKAFMAMQALREDGFARRTGPETYAITDAGRGTLTRLGAGEAVEVQAAQPNVRVFAIPHRSAA